MTEKDNLPNIIATIALIIFITFIMIVSRPKKDEPLQGGDIQKAIKTEQYR